MSPSRRSVQSGRASTRWRRASWGVRGMSSGIRLRLSMDGRRSGTRSGQQLWLQSAMIWSWLKLSWMEPVSLCHMVWSHQNTHTHGNVLPLGMTSKLSTLWISQRKYTSSFNHSEDDALVCSEITAGIVTSLSRLCVTTGSGSLDKKSRPRKQMLGGEKDFTYFFLD